MRPIYCTPNSGLSSYLSIEIVGAAIRRPGILQTKCHCREAIIYDFLRKSQYLQYKYWAGVLQSAANLLISMLAGGKHT